MIPVKFCNLYYQEKVLRNSRNYLIAHACETYFNAWSTVKTASVI